MLLHHPAQGFGGPQLACSSRPTSLHRTINLHHSALTETLPCELPASSMYARLPTLASSTPWHSTPHQYGAGVLLARPSASPAGQQPAKHRVTLDAQHHMLPRPCHAVRCTLQGESPRAAVSVQGQNVWLPCTLPTDNGPKGVTPGSAPAGSLLLPTFSRTGRLSR